MNQSRHIQAVKGQNCVLNRCMCLECGMLEATDRWGASKRRPLLHHKTFRLYKRDWRATETYGGWSGAKKGKEGERRHGGHMNSR